MKIKLDKYNLEGKQDFKKLQNELEDLIELMY